MTADEARKQAERDYPHVVDQAGREWLRAKPFEGDPPREAARYLIDFGHIVQLLELRRGVRFCELGCGTGWIVRLAARHGVAAAGYDISPAMIEIAREGAAADGVAARFEVGDMEELDLGRSFDACLTYDALHHSSRPDLVLASARRALRAGGRLLVVEPNWNHRFYGQDASAQFGTTELGYSPRRLRRLLREAGFTEIERFHPNRKRLFSNAPRDVLAHLAEPLVFRLLAPFWTQVWLRARAT